MGIRKRVVGTFYSEQEVIHAIKGLKRQGYRETDIIVVAKDRYNTLRLRAETDVMIEAGTPAISSLAGVMMDSFLTMMTGGMTKTQAGGLTSKLVRMGIQDFTAKQCETDVDQGKILVLIDVDKTQTIPSYTTVREAPYETEEHKAVQLREEQLDVRKELVQTGGVQLRKEIVEEQRTIQVPVIREEAYVERRPVVDGQHDGSPLTENEIIRIPIMEERIEVTKRPVVVEEVIIGKRKIQEIKEMKDTIRKEEARVEQSESTAVPELADSEMYQNVAKSVDQSQQEAATALAPKAPKEEKVTLSTNNKKREAHLKVKTSPVIEELEKVADSIDDQKPDNQVKDTDITASEKEENNKNSTNKKKK
ncbi:YsnF/AvaK domain-containing protein [Priestia filamentosa]|uniref:YsnF/AvaK domain-containing protein n=1 Tax=Priestia filamentosa TaxID=1402861 RepID=UPI000A08D282|nr:YsnF/AvaK domain-containing protein [Priestia filamentosa]MDT3765798.1 YsnF/AvaK domain-containing protein [Priestia filamentosa]OXS65247.1 stress response protein ysnF [Priestia filamentosa]SMF69720.1 conserved domain-containing protein [Priestia filamentosa]